MNVPDIHISNRKICIIDSGYALEHQDLPKDTVTGYEGPLSAGNWTVDGSGHGTHVAGTIVALGGNDMVRDHQSQFHLQNYYVLRSYLNYLSFLYTKGVPGVIRNGQAKVHIVKVFSNEGSWAWRSSLIAGK